MILFVMGPAMKVNVNKVVEDAVSNLDNRLSRSVFTHTQYIYTYIFFLIYIYIFLLYSTLNVMIKSLLFFHF